MNVGELFVSLGVKGSDKTVGAITQARTGLKDTASMGLQTKAAIIGVMYALEQLFSASNRSGNSLSNFSALIGMNAQALQRYQYAARLVGISNEEMGGTFKSLQDTMTKALMNKAIPEGLGRVAELTGAIGQEDFALWADRPELLFERLQKYLSLEKDVGFANEMARSFGLSDNAIAASRRGAFSPEILAKAPVYNDGQVDALARNYAETEKLKMKIERSIGEFNAKHGGQLIKDISMITEKVIALANAFQAFSDKAHLFEWLSKVFEGWAHIFDGLVTAINWINSRDATLSNLDGAQNKDYLPEHLRGASEAEIKKYREARAKTPDIGFMDFFAELYGRMVMGGNAPVKSTQDLRNGAKDGGGKVLMFTPASPSAAAIPARAQPAGSAVGGGGNQTNNVTVNQNLNFQHPGTDAARTSESAKDGAKKAFNSFDRSRVN